MHDWLSHSRRQLMGLPIKGWHAIKSVFRLAFRRFPYPAVSQIRPKRRLEWSIRTINPKQLFATPCSQHSRNHCLISRFLCLAFFPSV